MFLSVFFLSIIGLLSGIVNGNPLLVTILGIFDYIKYFLVIFIYAVFFKEFSQFKKGFRLLLMLSIFVGVVASVQEFWAVSLRYILGKDLSYSKMYVLTQYFNLPDDPGLINCWRFGLYRASSLMENPNFLGLYTLLFLTLYIFFEKKMKNIVLIPLVAGVFAGISRMAYTAATLIIGIFISKGKKGFLVLIIPLMIFVYYAGISLPDFDVTEETAKAGLKSYRHWTRIKAVEIWKDHPILGVGPGMYGGIVSLKYYSPVYVEYYSFAGEDLMLRTKSLDQFWPQLLAEMGIAGIVFFAAILISLLIGLLIIIKRTSSDEIKSMSAGLASFMAAILVYLLGSGLNATCILYTYTALIGMILGCYMVKESDLKCSY